jgi:site-specific recombinase XerD
MPVVWTTTIPKYLTQSEAQAFFGVITGARDRALFSLIYHYGLRVSEVALLKRQDVDFERKRLVVKRVKGGVWAERPLFESTEKLLLKHLRSIPEGRDSLFPGRRGPLKKRQIQALFTRYRDRAGLDRRYTTHCLRHSIATHLIDAGLPMAFVQDHLGHKNIQSTTIYARISGHHREAVFRKLEASPWIIHPEPAHVGRAGRRPHSET